MASSSKIKASKASDWLYGTDKNNKINGLAGDDLLYGLQGNDKLSGDVGDDTLYGDLGNDNLSGGDGNDTLLGGLGRDKLSGGKGNDRLYGGDDESEIEADTLSGGDGHDTLYGRGGNDKLSGDAGDDDIDGGDGNDKLSGGKGEDSLYGGAGSDNLSGGDDDDYLNGGFDLLKDVLNGGAGNDRISLRAEDAAIGGKGVDTLVVNAFSFTSDPVVYAINLSKISGKKAASIGYLNMKAGQFEKAVLDVTDAAAGSAITGSTGDDRITVDGVSGLVKGGKGNDYLSAYSFSYTGGLSDGFTLDGGAGNDRLSAEGDNNKLIGGAGNDLFIANHNAVNSTILDFSAADRILISRHEWAHFKTVDRANFLVAGSDPVANSTGGQFLYDTDDGRLLYDRDGTGSAAAIEIFVLANKASLKASSFLFDF
jgi:Ca2+-binding RTX toxin-like protein